MNSKPTILISENKTVFSSFYLEDIWSDFFTVEKIDSNKSYDKHSTVVVSDYREYHWKNNTEETKLAQKGFKHIIDHCWDSWDAGFDSAADFTLRPRDFNRINESLWYSASGYDKYNFDSTPHRDYLLLMNQRKPHRDSLHDRLDTITENVYSYRGKGIPLQNGIDQPENETDWQRYTNPDWYRDTRFSIVCETLINEQREYYDMPNPPVSDFICVTEKTYKPIAFKHPSVVWGQVGTLEWLKNLGFETWDHAIDESYDAIEDDDIRLESIIKQINTICSDKTIFTDSVSKQKIEHNFNLFYNTEEVMKLFREQMVYPLMEFIES